MIRKVAFIFTVILLLTQSMPTPAYATIPGEGASTGQMRSGEYRRGDAITGEAPQASNGPLNLSPIASTNMISVSITGETEGELGVTYFFTATVEPVTALLPITYTWEATDQTAQVHHGHAISDAVSFTWSLTGTKQITVTTVNTTEGISATHRIQVLAELPPSSREIHFPLVLRDYGSSGISTPEEALDALDDYQETPVIAGTAYYVANDGNDNHNGTSPDTPWRTLTKVNSQALSPGDGVLFQRGDEWREMLVIASSGTENAPIIYGAYGTGKAPAILGSTAITTWENVTGNVWRGTTAVEDPSRGAPHDGSTQGSGGWPGGAWFIAHDGAVTWGNQEKYLSEGYQVLEERYDWGWQNGYVYIYSAGDPASRWRAMEVSQRSSAIEVSSNHPQDWIVIDNIQMLFTQSKGFFAGYPAMEAEGLTISHCHVAWVGIRGGIAADGLKVWHSQSVYANNVIHDCGRHGIGVLPLGGNVDVVTDLYFDNNTFYNGFHTTGVDVEACNANRLSNFTFINNQFLGSPDYDLGSEEAFNSNHIWTEPGSGILANFRFINNIFTYSHGKGVAINAIDGTEVYHNTFYGVNPTLSNVQGQLYYVGSVKNSTVRNNIFYNDVDTSLNSGFYSVKLNNYQMSEIDMDYNLHYATDPNAPIVKIIEISGAYQMDEWNTYMAATGWDSHSPIPQNPLFVAANNYHLQSGSPARATGIYISAANIDRDGNDRADPPSLGVYE